MFHSQNSSGSVCFHPPLCRLFSYLLPMLERLTRRGKNSLKKKKRVIIYFIKHVQESVLSFCLLKITSFSVQLRLERDAVVCVLMSADNNTGPVQTFRENIHRISRVGKTPDDDASELRATATIAAQDKREGAKQYANNVYCPWGSWWHRMFVDGRDADPHLIYFKGVFCSFSFQSFGLILVTPDWKCTHFLAKVITPLQISHRISCVFFLWRGF